MNWGREVTLAWHAWGSEFNAQYHIQLAMVAQAGGSKGIRSLRFDNTGSWRPTRAQGNLVSRSNNQSIKQTKSQLLLNPVLNKIVIQIKYFIHVYLLLFCSCGKTTYRRKGLQNFQFPGQDLG